MRNSNPFLLLLFFIVTAAYSQDQPLQPHVIFNDSLIEGRGNLIFYDTVRIDDPNTAGDLSGSSEVSVIVEFVDEPAPMFVCQKVWKRISRHCPM